MGWGRYDGRVGRDTVRLFWRGTCTVPHSTVIQPPFKAVRRAACFETQELSGTRLGAGEEWLERSTECAGAQAFLSKGRIVDAGLSHRHLGEAARSEEDPGLVRRPGRFLVGSEILKDMQLQISRGYAVRACAVIDRASLVFDLRLFRSAKLRRLCTKCRAADLRIHPARMSCSSLLFACLAPVALCMLPACHGIV